MKRKLLEPFRIGKMQLKNRIVMAPMETQYAAEDGCVTERNKDYYEARARGGAALIIVEATYIHRQGWAHANQLSISDDRFIPGLSEMVQVIHKHGAKAAIQINHAGRDAKMAAQNGIQIVAPSPLASPLVGKLPEELTVDRLGKSLPFLRTRHSGLRRPVSMVWKSMGPTATSSANFCPERPISARTSTEVTCRTVPGSS